ncbi:MAG: imidazole glycerol phosphate synthase subunit HisH, partial [Cyanobium sp.]
MSGSLIRLGLVDYGMGNLHSVQRSFERLGAEVVPVGGEAAMEGCTALVLPGVGAFDPAMERLAAADLVEPLRRSCAVGRPLLGICLGLQLLFEGSSEGQAEGLGVLAGRVEALPRWPGHPIPHMG